MKDKLLKVAQKTALFSVLSLVWINGFAADSVEDRLQRLEQMADSRGQLQADLVFQLNAIQQELQQLRGQIEEHSHQLKQLQDRQRDLYRDIERRLAQLQSPSSAAATSGSQTRPDPVRQQPAPPTIGSSSSNGDVHSEYQQIFPLVRAGKYDEAIGQYMGFLRKHPNSQYESNVHYWLGQIYFIRQELDKSEASFSIVSTKHPDSAKAPDALFKQGKILVIREQWQAAKSIFESVIEKYDGTIEQLARKELDSLKAAGH